MTDYTIERGFGVRERMDLLAKVRGPATMSMLDAIGIGEGDRCIDLGCGGGHVAIELAKRVGPGGFVLGIDLDEALLEVARGEADAQGLTNVRFRVSAVEEVAESDLDFGYSRLLFMHLADPEKVAELLAGSVRAGGTVALEDAEFSACFTYPRCSAYDGWVGWYQEAVRRNGGDPNIGPRLPSLLRSVGVTNVGVRVAQDAFVSGPEKQLQEMSMAKQKAAVVSAGVATADEYDAAYAEVQAFAADPSTLIAGPRIVQAWGQRP
jgi:SAM-dependent methyltransferase